MIRKPLYIMFFAALNFFYISSAEASSWWACCDIDDAVNPNTMIDNGENSTKHRVSTAQPNPEEVPRNTGNNNQQGNHTDDSLRGSIITSGNTGNNAKLVDGTFHSLSRENAFSSQQEAENPEHNKNRSGQVPYKSQNITIRNNSDDDE